MNLLNVNDDNFRHNFAKLLVRGSLDLGKTQKIVEQIISDVRSRGDDALMEHIKRFDNWQPNNALDLAITQKELNEAYKNTPSDLKNALKTSFDRIYAFHEKQRQKTWLDISDDGIILGQKVSAIERAGLYIPGGKAAYPSSVLMNAIPAIVAGVNDISICVPTPNAQLNPLVLAAIKMCGIEKVYKVGGASAIAAFAYGTRTIQKRDLITGPGNIFVATAKKMVFGDVQIDMIAGPSEIGIIADDFANPRLVAIDLLSQAEHDEMASSILITHSKDLISKVQEELFSILENLPRKDIAKKSIENRSAFICTNDTKQSCELMNEIAPEHLEIMCKNPFELLPLIKNAGAIFLGENTPEAIGDYTAGPNHTLPTGSTARFFSPLSVDNFIKKSSILHFSKEALLELSDATQLIANTEGLSAHAMSVSMRKNKD